MKKRTGETRTVPSVVFCFVCFVLFLFANWKECRSSTNSSHTLSPGKLKVTVKWLPLCSETCIFIKEVRFNRKKLKPIKEKDMKATDLEILYSRSLSLSDPIRGVVAPGSTQSSQGGADKGSAVGK